MTDGAELRRARHELKRAYDHTFSRVAQILFETDPVGINFEFNADEYEPEAGTILPHLRACRSVEDVQSVIYLEFVRWFDAGNAGPIENYRAPAERIWTEMQAWTLP